MQLDPPIPKALPFFYNVSTIFRVKYYVLYRNI